MVEDDKGFIYPVIDYKACNKCGLCDKVCAFDENYKGFGDKPCVYAVKNKDDVVRGSSTSGGMFVAISDKILEHGGVVYGAGFNDRLYVCHKRAATKEERDEFKGSKYVQSNMGDNFVQVKKDLKNNLKVLFTGTPCQVSALNSFLKRDYNNLLTVDFICHGVPSNKIWQDFLGVIEKNTSNEVVGVEFRNKDTGWHRPKTKLHLKRECTKKIKGEQSYFQLFLPNYMLMPACHNCKYTNFNRVSDITIADFWGIERTMPEFDDDKGISLVLVNSNKGSTLFETVRGGLEVRESNKQDCFQRNIGSPPPRHRNSDIFWRDYHKRGMRYVMVKYTDYGVVKTFMMKVIRKIKSVLSPYFKQA